MELDTCFTPCSGLVDDWYKGEIAPRLSRRQAGTLNLSAREGLTVAFAGQRRPWPSARGLLRDLPAPGRGGLPGRLHRSAFNRRVRPLGGAWGQLQPVVAGRLHKAAAGYAGVDSLPLPASSQGQAARPPGHGLWPSPVGRGQEGEGFGGDPLRVRVPPRGFIGAWVAAPDRSSPIRASRGGAGGSIGDPPIRPKCSAARPATPARCAPGRRSGNAG